MSQDSKNNLQENLRSRIKASGMSTPEIVQKAGLNISAVKNILSGRSTNPSGNTLIGLSQALGCSIEELITCNETSNPLKNKDLPVENYKLFLDGAALIANYLEQEKIVIPQSEYIRYVNEVYQYSLMKKWKRVDADFVKWHLSISLKN